MDRTTRTKRLDPALEARFLEGVRDAERFHMAGSAVHNALLELAERLDELGVPYAVIGAMALNAYGYNRVTVDIDVLLTREGLDRFRDAWLGRGYTEKFEGSRGMRDTANDVPIDVVLAGEFPGDGEPKPVSFPDPSATAVRGESIALLPLERLLELKLASGISAPHRLRDLADVLEVIRTLGLPRDFAKGLDLSVRPKFDELWQSARTDAE